MEMPSVDSLSIPSNSVVYAIGDIHGQDRQLHLVIDWILDQARSDDLAGLRPVVVFLGDYIDRGENSQGVIETLCRLEKRVPSVRWVFLAGNHEASVLGFLAHPQDHAPWLRFGGTETLLSYGVIPPADGSAKRLSRCRDDFAQALPPDHLDFLRRLDHSFEWGDYIFVHAGLRPGIDLRKQAPEDMLWIRDEFLNHPTWYGKCVVHGHTIEAEPSLHPWRIGIDTGAYCGGPLSCLVLRGNQRKVVGFKVGDGML